MREADFKAWLTGMGYDSGTISTQLARAKRLDQAYGDLDVLFDRDKFTGLVATLTYSAADKRKRDPNPSRLEIDGDLYSNLASYRATLNFYQRFRDDVQTGRRPHTPKLGEFAGEVSRMMAVFKERMSDFISFAKEEGEFWETEAAYKLEARAAVIEALSDPAKSDEHCGRAICKALGQGTRSGLPLSWRTLGEVAKAPTTIQQRFFETVARLARLPAGDHAGLLECARELESLRDDGLTSLKRGEVLGIAISVYGTVNVNDACWFKARTFDRLGKALLGHKLFASPRFEIADFEEFQQVMNRIRDQLDDWNWQTGSLMDVQGFIWISRAEEWGSTQMSDLTREAVELAMDECEEIGVEAFLAKYQFGKPRDYWVRRANERLLYPAKATVGAAYGFMPNGKPQSAKEFYGGFGEQAANGILQRLGFEIVSGKGDSVADSGEAELAAVSAPTNLILYGPPGTGKTYTTAAEAVRLCGEAVPEDREQLMALYRSLHKQGRIDFVTFHQNFSYEDFVEGLRPATGQGEEASAGFELRPEPGIFRRMAEAAAKPIARREAAFELEGRRIFKLSLGEAGKREWEWVYEQSIEDGYALFGFRDIDWSDARFSDRNEILAELQKRYPDEKITFQTGLVKSPDRFRNQLSVGDVVIISKGLNAFRAIGVVEGDYEYAPRPEGRYCHRRKVRWLWEEPQGVPVEEISSKRFSLDTVYELPKDRLNLAAIERYINSGYEGETNGEILPHVLIIDEINRANISKVFGELITLLEPDKRLGMPNALTLRLPYSKREFGVPSNLHIVGTMNTADRSIALLDTALRRRFVFREIAPDPSLLPEDIDGIPLRQVLETLNDRIEYLVDREHRIGHAFFIGCRDRAAVDAAMRDKVIPLLQEYFFEDWGRVAAVLGERPEKGGGFLDCRKLKDPTGNGGDERESWSVRPQFAPDAYERLIGKPVLQSVDARADDSIEEAAE